MDNDFVKIHLLPGGLMPKRQTSGAVGYDVHVRAIVSPSETDSENSKLRKTLFNFKDIPEDLTVAGHVLWQPKADGGGNELIYRMKPHDSVLVGIGFVTEMPFPMYYWVTPRSGLAAKWGVTVTNAPGTVDPDYRGEAGVLVYNRADTSFDLRHGMRIAQIIFQYAVIPDLDIVEKYEELIDTPRGVGGFGSTGWR